MKGKNKLKTRLAIFDFDGTLANTPVKPLSAGDYRSWNGKDWWGSHASLISPDEGGFYDGSFNQNVVDAFRDARNSPETDAIVLTGRRGVIAHMVRKHLRLQGFTGHRMIDPQIVKAAAHFVENCRSGRDILHTDDECGHEEYFCGDCVVNNKIQGTFGHKKEVLERKVIQNGGYDLVEVWDDRVDHLDLLKMAGKELMSQGLVKEYIIHRVIPPKFEGATAVIIDIPVV